MNDFEQMLHESMIEADENIMIIESTRDEIESTLFIEDFDSIYVEEGYLEDDPNEIDFSISESAMELNEFETIEYYTS